MFQLAVACNRQHWDRTGGHKQERLGRLGSGWCYKHTCIHICRGFLHGAFIGWEDGRGCMEDGHLDTSILVSHPPGFLGPGILEAVRGRSEMSFGLG